MDKYFVINSRLHDINFLLTQRPNLISSYGLIEGALNNQITVNYLDIADKSIALSLSSPNLAAVSRSVDSLQKSAKNNKKFRSLLLSGISYDAIDRTYEMIITVNLL